MSWVKSAYSRIPNLHAREFLWWQGNILIDDTANKGFLEISSCVDFTVPMLIYSAEELSTKLRDHISYDQYIAVVYPGNGAAVCKQFMDSPEGISVKAKRVGYKNPTVEVWPFVCPKGVIAIMDDVVCSGATAAEVFKRGDVETADLFSWIVQYPRDDRLNCFRKVVCAVCVRGPYGKVPINSVSTFLAKEEIAKAYASRFVHRQEDFLDALSLLKC